MKRAFKDNNGLSLIEILVSLAIMGLLASMISVIMVSGSNYFRKQGASIDLQNDSQLISTSLTTAILEGTGFTLKEDTLSGKTVTVFDTGRRSYVWVNDVSAADNGWLYIYDTGAAVDFNEGNCLSKSVTALSVSAKTVSVTEADDGSKSYTYAVVSSASKIDSIYVEYTLANTHSELTQSFEIKPRNTGAGYTKITE